MTSLFVLLQIIFQIESGDLLFQNCDCGPICDAIEDVTSQKGERYSHIAIAFRDSMGNMNALEANTLGVVAVPLDSFMNRYLLPNGKPAVDIGRLKKTYQKLNKKALLFMISKIGKPYDFGFSLNNDSFYCSELIYEAYFSANKNQPFFPLNKMTFKLPNSKNPHPEFSAYYHKLKRPIPEGEWGINPAAISRNKKLRLTFSENVTYKW